MFATARSHLHNPALFRFSVGVLVWCTLGLLAGGWTTTINAGMAFLDWPLSNGSINPEGFLVEADQTAEHSHRLIMAMLGLFCAAIGVWAHCVEASRRVRLLAWCLPGLVFFQGLLGGARVLFDPRNFSEKTGAVSRVFAISHAVTALLTVGLLAVLVTLFSRRWRESAAAPVSAPVRRFAVAVAALVWLQALLGALVRQHRWSVWDMSGRPEGAEVGPYLAEWASGAFLSRMSSGWPFALNAAHRIGAALVALAVAALATMIFRDRSARGPLGTPAVALVAATLFQVFLGVVQIWFNANTHARNAHHLGGALVFCSAAVLALLACRSAFRETEARP